MGEDVQLRRLAKPRTTGAHRSARRGLRNRNNRYRFKQIYRAANYNDPIGAAPAPLDPPGMAGVNVKEGEYLLAIDGGRIQLPNRAAYQPDGLSWGVENVGVSPDYEVENLPQDWIKGRDAQLEKAIQVALDELKKTAPALPKKPKYPIHK